MRVSFLFVAVSVVVVACSSFGADEANESRPVDGSSNDASTDGGIEDAPTDDAATTDPDATTGASPGTLWCLGKSCTKGEKCCIAADGQSGACVALANPCGTDESDLRCSDSASCAFDSGVCCAHIAPVQNTSALRIVDSYCTPAKDCSIYDDHQVVLCSPDVETTVCPSGQCVPYRSSINGSYSIVPSRYGLCRK